MSSFSSIRRRYGSLRAIDQQVRELRRDLTVTDAIRIHRLVHHGAGDDRDDERRHRMGLDPGGNGGASRRSSPRTSASRVRTSVQISTIGVRAAGSRGVDEDLEQARHAVAFGVEAGTEDRDRAEQSRGGIVGVAQLVERRLQPVTQFVSERGGDQVVLGPEVVGDRSEVHARALGDRARRSVREPALPHARPGGEHQSLPGAGVKVSLRPALARHTFV